MAKPVIASYSVRVTLRGPAVIKPPTNKQIEATMKEVITLDMGLSTDVSVKVESTRTDK